MVGADGIDRFAICDHSMDYEPSTFALKEAKASCFENLVGTDGIEPSTFALSEQRSTTELRAQISKSLQRS